MVFRQPQPFAIFVCTHSFNCFRCPEEFGKLLPPEPLESGYMDIDRGSAVFTPVMCVSSLSL